jgi:Periplasmic copper-binding protein (NosD)
MKTLLQSAARLFIVGMLSYQASLFAQGSLTPLTAPAPSMKTLDQIEPRTPISALPFAITQPGSYYVTRNLTISSAASGITIQSDNVSIDLGGFILDGAGKGIDGITVDSVRDNIQVRHGTLQNWTQHGVFLQSLYGGIVEGLAVHGNAVGISATSSIVRGCTANRNSGTGIIVNSGTARDCVAVSDAIGINALYSTLRDSSVQGCTDTGITVYDGTVESCTVIFNRYGIVVQGSSVDHNNVNGSGSDGIRVTGSGSDIADNNVTGSGSTISSSGIWVPSDNNRVLHNHVASTTGFGIGVAGSFNTVDGNSVIRGNNIGIYVSGGTKNTIVRNAALGNGSPAVNYSIATGNNPGPIDAANASTNSWSNTQ